MPTVFIPSIKKSGDVAAEGGEEHFGMNEKAYQFSQGWLGLLGERAKIMVCDSRLVRCAQDHAIYLDSRTPEEIAARAHIKAAMHISRDGTMANARVVAAGYRLPSHWPLNKNNVEDCARDWREPAIVAVELANHDTHHDHMYGIGGFSILTVYGVGNCNLDFVIVICPPEAQI